MATMSYMCNLKRRECRTVECMKKVKSQLEMFLKPDRKPNELPETQAELLNNARERLGALVLSSWECFFQMS